MPPSLKHYKHMFYNVPKYNESEVLDLIANRDPRASVEDWQHDDYEPNKCIAIVYVDDDPELQYVFDIYVPQEAIPEVAYMSEYDYDKYTDSYVMEYDWPELWNEFATVWLLAYGQIRTVEPV